MARNNDFCQQKRIILRPVIMLLVSAGGLVAIGLTVLAWPETRRALHPVAMAAHQAAFGVPNP